MRTLTVRDDTPWVTSILRLIVLAAVLTFAVSANAEPSSYFFKVDALNEGLPPLDDEIDVATPQSAVETFVFAAERKDFATAAQVLDLRKVSPALQKDLGPQLAEKLAVVLERRALVNWKNLPERPDALEQNAPKDDPLAGSVRRSLRLGLLTMGDRTIAVRLNRYKVGDNLPRWAFSRQTVENIDEMYRKFGPTKFEQSLPDWALANVFLGVQVWELVALPIILIISTFVGLLIYRLIHGAGSNVGLSYLKVAANKAAMPIAVLVATFMTWFLIDVIVGSSGAVALFLNPVLAAMLVFAVLAMLVRVIDALFERMIERRVDDIADVSAIEERDFYTNVSAARRILLVLATILGIAIVLQITNIFENVGLSLAASASVVTLVLVFAGREILANILSSLQIAFSKSARIGDQVTFEGEYATVERINFATLQLKTWDDRRLIVPVREFVSQTFENWSKGDTQTTRSVYITLDHRADPQRVRGLFMDFVEKEEEIANPDEAVMFVTKQDRDGMIVRLTIDGETASTSYDIEMRAREYVLREIQRIEREEGIVMLPVERQIDRLSNNTKGF